ncbi:MAG: alanine racemase [Treponema sp.]|nr:alanine racemase [Treponema sp.]
MFLNLLQKNNPGLIDYGVFLLEHGIIEPDTYVIDLDGIEENAGRLAGLAGKYNIVLYFMAKQLGHNPEICRRVLAESGFTGMVAVDFREALILHSAGLPVRHLGHLCQVPQRQWDTALDMGPEVITIFSCEKARELSAAAKQRGIIQNVLLRIWDRGDIFYQGQEGGFPLDKLPQTLDLFMGLEGLRIAGVTSFPCFLYQSEQKISAATPNAGTLVRGADILRKHGILVSQINMPSGNSIATIPLAAELGATHLEPGHSLTGTNPDNLNEAVPLKPCMLYMSEVSHQHKDYSCCFGGGYYRRGNLANALVKTAAGYSECSVLAPDPQSIDYHLKLSGHFPAGAPVCMSFRTQIFVTRSRIALAEGLSQSRPALHSIWDSSGNKVS